jgi:hypothetical protein
VQRRKVDAVFNSPNHVLVNDDGLREFFGTMHDTVTDSVNIGKRPDAGNLGLGGNHPSNNVIEGSAMVTQRYRLFQRRLARRLQRHERLTSDAFNETFSLLLVGVLVDDVEIGLDDLKLQ